MDNDEIKNITDQVIEFLEENPQIKEAVINRLVSQKNNNVQDDFNAHIRQKLYRKLRPFVFVGAYTLGAVTMISTNKGVTFPVDDEVKYKKIEDAPVTIQEAYVGDQYSEYLNAVESNPDLENETFVNSVRQFGKLVSEGADEYKIDEVAKNINNGTMTDRIDSTLPFTSTVYPRSIVDGNSILEPISESTQLEDNEQIVVRETGIYRRR